MNGCGFSFTHLLWLKCGLLRAQLVNTEIKGLVSFSYSIKKKFYFGLSLVIVSLEEDVLV